MFVTVSPTPRGRKVGIATSRGISAVRKSTLVAEFERLLWFRLIEAAAVREREVRDGGGRHEGCGSPTKDPREFAVHVLAHDLLVVRDTHHDEQERGCGDA